MKNDNPSRSNSQGRYRGPIYIALALDPPGDDNAAIGSIAVCADMLGACRAIADVPHGDIMYAAPDNPAGGFRAFMEGGEPPYQHVPTTRHRRKAVPELVEATGNDVSRRTARKALESYLADACGFGGECYRVLGPEWHGGVLKMPGCDARRQSFAGRRRTA